MAIEDNICMDCLVTMIMLGTWNQYICPVNGSILLYSDTLWERSLLFCAGVVKGEYNWLCVLISTLAHIEKMIKFCTYLY